jgi:putative ABC transport system permease protein
MTFVLTAVILGLIFTFLALGILISFRIFSFADITTDGSLTIGAATTTVLLVHEVSPVLATLAGFAAGGVGGVLTAFLYTRCNINGFLAGILVIPMLYSVSYRLLEGGRVHVPESAHLAHTTGQLQVTLTGYPPDEVEEEPLREGGRVDWELLVFLLLLVAALAGFMIWFFRTELGVAMRATGDNPVMVRGLGVDVGNMTILGLALANGLAGLTGALVVQFQGYADPQIGVGMIVWGLASVMVGEMLFPGKQPARMISRTVLGAVLFRILLHGVLTTGLEPSDLKLVSALFVLAMLLYPIARQWFVRPVQEKENA